MGGALTKKTEVAMNLANQAKYVNPSLAGPGAKQGRSCITALIADQESALAKGGITEKNDITYGAPPRAVSSGRAFILPGFIIGEQVSEPGRLRAVCLFTTANSKNLIFAEGFTWKLKPDPAGQGCC
ncbi:MAG: hypothetical protein ABFR97_08205 [Thermodesulfobacteriota bacterium]